MADPKVVYACVNYCEAVCSNEIMGQFVCINGGIEKVLDDTMYGMESTAGSYLLADIPERMRIKWKTRKSMP